MAVSKECLHVFYLRPQPHTLRTASQATNVSVAACEFATYTLTQTNSGHAVMKNYLKTLEAKRRRRWCTNKHSFIYPEEPTCTIQ